MIAILRAIAGIILGTIVAFVLIIAVELFSSVVYPIPAGLEQTMENICKHVENYPAWVLAAVIPMWAATVFLSTWIAGKIGNIVPAMVVGLLLLAAVIFNMSMLPYPLWLELANLVMCPLAIVAGSWLSLHRLSALQKAKAATVQS